MTYEELCTFPLWQLTVSRLDPDNFDDMGCMGRPYLDAARTIWQKLIMTEEDLCYSPANSSTAKASAFS
uniref:hypothetical protein n=1 Tax=Vibrio cholerae TaxID=666 RepID=UPI003F585844